VVLLLQIRSKLITDFWYSNLNLTCLVEMCLKKLKWYALYMIRLGCIKIVYHDNTLSDALKKLWPFAFFHSLHSRFINVSHLNLSNTLQSAFPLIHHGNDPKFLECRHLINTAGTSSQTTYDTNQKLLVISRCLSLEIPTFRFKSPLSIISRYNHTVIT
jgi:hypothetical protein